MNYLEFISNEDLEKHVKSLYTNYEIANENQENLKKFYSNKIDPIKALFDIRFNDLSPEEFVLAEITRQRDKTISNAIGKFHERLIGSVNSKEKMELLPEKHITGLDIKNSTDTIFGEVKNKHNTTKGEDKKSIYKKLVNIAEKYPNSTCYYIQIIAQKSINRIWKFSYKEDGVQCEANHPRVREISADKFYELITGDSDSFLYLCNALPKVINNLNLNPCKDFASNIYTELTNLAKSEDHTILEQLFNDTFSSYEGFKDN